MKVFFPGLNSLRAVAALSVVVAHIEGFKKKAHIPNLHEQVGLLGPLGVNLFFVLSGFLISYLLILEHQKQGSIHIPKFYIRRILRIWPLYFLIVICGFFVFPDILNPNYFQVKTTPHFFEKLAFTTFFLPNLTLYIYGSIFTIGVLWSVGAEEQFYLFWPHLVNLFKAKLYLPLSCLLSLIITIKVFYYYFAQSYSSKLFTVIVAMLPFDYMCIGGLFAYSYFKKDKFYIFACSNKTFYTCILIVALLVFNYELTKKYMTFSNILFGFSFAVIIVNISTNNKLKFFSNNRLLDYLGKTSYGIYMYHSIAIAVSIKAFSGVYNYNFSIYSSSLTIVLALSSFSFFFYENKILKFKDKFMVVKSTNINNKP